MRSDLPGFLLFICAVVGDILSYLYYIPVKSSQVINPLNAFFIVQRADSTSQKEMRFARLWRIFLLLLRL